MVSDTSAMCVGAPGVENALEEIVGSNITYTCKPGHTMPNGSITITLACECNHDWQTAATILGNCEGTYTFKAMHTITTMLTIR